jgi:ATP-dependent RNA helicase DDX47/RRP3
VAKHKLKAQEKEAQSQANLERKASQAENETVLQVDEDIKQLTSSSFADLGVCPEICKACEGMGYKHPSKI